MPNQMSQLFNDRPTGLRHKIAGIYALLLVFSVVAWAWALTAFHGQPALLGTALLAYTFGLRHAVDADHIAAIDNVTRKLLQIDRSPLGAGLFFSLGHSTVVVALTVGVAFAATALTTHFDDLRGFGGLIGTSVSALFLFVLAIANLVVLASVIRTFRAVRRGEPLVETDLDLLLNNRGFLSRLLRPLLRLVSRSWHLYPVGFLFGLGFDTATEVALFGISAAQASHGLSFWSVLVLPILFTAGMSLVDTTDGILMLGAYRWAFCPAHAQALLQHHDHVRFRGGRGGDRRDRGAGFAPGQLRAQGPILGCYRQPQRTLRAVGLHRHWYFHCELDRLHSNLQAQALRRYHRENAVTENAVTENAVTLRLNAKIHLSTTSVDASECLTPEIGKLGHAHPAMPGCIFY